MFPNLNVRRRVDSPKSLIGHQTRGFNREVSTEPVCGGRRLLFSCVHVELSGQPAALAMVTVTGGSQRARCGVQVVKTSDLQDSVGHLHPHGFREILPKLGISITDKFTLISYFHLRTFHKEEATPLGKGSCGKGRRET